MTGSVNRTEESYYGRIGVGRFTRSIQYRGILKSPGLLPPRNSTFPFGNVPKGCRDLVVSAISRPGFSCLYKKVTIVVLMRRPWEITTTSLFRDVVLSFDFIVWLSRCLSKSSIHILNEKNKER